MANTDGEYGDGATSFNAAGGVEGIRRLVDDFYDFMDTLPEAETIRRMHPNDPHCVARQARAVFVRLVGRPQVVCREIPDNPDSHLSLAV